jgi:hypothetical protein
MSLGGAATSLRGSQNTIRKKKKGGAVRCNEVRQPIDGAGCPSTKQYGLA